MANNTDLAKEIEEAEGDITRAVSTVQDAITIWENLQKMCVMDETQYVEVHDTLVKASDTLQRARDALRWIPCEERLPERGGKLRSYRCTRNLYGRLVQESVYWVDGGWCQPGVVAWMENPPTYTPEEKGEE